VRDVQTNSRSTVVSDEPEHLTPICPSYDMPMVLREAGRGGYAGQNSGAVQIVRKVEAHDPSEVAPRTDSPQTSTGDGTNSCIISGL